MAGGRVAMGPADLSGVGPSVEVESIAAGGDGVARLPDGRVAFVARSAPGDRVTLDLVEEKARFVRARIATLEHASAQRREPPCALWERCGGCPLQHLVPEAQREARARFVSDALSRLGGLEVPTPEIEASPQEFGYRSRLSFSLRRIGGDRDRPPRVIAGYREAGDPRRIVDVHGECLLGEPGLIEAWQRLRAVWGEGARLLPGGRELRLTLRRVDEGFVLLVEGGHGPGSAEALLREMPDLVAVWQRTRARGDVLLAGSRLVHERWLDDPIAVPGSSFVQVNRTVAEQLYRHVVAELGDVSGLRGLDAYAGLGLYAREFARGGAHMTAIELDPAACAALATSAPEQVHTIEGRVEDHVASVLPVDFAILNPPRGGIDAAVAEALTAQPVRDLIYVSCDPATLARDLGRLSEGYEIRRVRAFDLFPQTAHVETAVTLVARP